MSNNILHENSCPAVNSFATEILSGGNIIHDSKEIVSKFNNFFVNIRPDLAKKIIPGNPNTSITDTMPTPNSSSFFIAPCTSNETQTVVTNLSNSNGIGIDGFLIRPIKFVIEYLAIPLASIFNKSFQTGVFPDRLNHVNITPVHKGNDKRLINNYRPISILPVFSKVLEKLMHFSVILH